MRFRSVLTVGFLAASGHEFGYIRGNRGVILFAMNETSWMANQVTCPWRSAAVTPPLKHGEIHLWWVPLAADTGETKRLGEVLSPPEKARAARYRFQRHSDAFVVGRGTLRYLLHGYTGLAPDQIRFQYGAKGKPRLGEDASGNRLSFNYSDAGGRAIYGFTWNAELGVDLEDLNREVRFERIVQRKFTTVEAASNLKLSSEDRRAAFLACWTRKEGYGKARGWGIHYPLDSVELCVDCVESRFELNLAGKTTDAWIVRQLYPSDHFVASLVYPASMENGLPPKISYLSMDPARWCP